MTKRMIAMLSAMAVLVTILAVVKVQQVQAAIAKASSFAPPPDAITTAVASLERWPATLDAIGTVVAAQGVVVSADLPGIVARIGFDSGRAAAAGEVLVELDAKQEQAQLVAAEAQRELARLQLERMRGLWKEGIVARSRYDDAVAADTSAESRVGEIRATIDRKVIRAPFSGVLGLRQVNLGQYLNGGSPVVQLQSLSPIHVNFAVPQHEIAKLRRGVPVAITVKDREGAALRGELTAIDSIVDEGTRSVQVQATLGNQDGTLRPGMFVNASVDLGSSAPVVTLPATAISHAPYGDSIFVVDEMTGPDGRSYRAVRQQFVEIGGARGDQVAVLSGVEEGEEVASSGVFKLRNGAAVQVDNTTPPANEVAPRPENS